MEKKKAKTAAGAGAPGRGAARRPFRPAAGALAAAACLVMTLQAALLTALLSKARPTPLAEQPAAGPPPPARAALGRPLQAGLLPAAPPKKQPEAKPETEAEAFLTQTLFVGDSNTVRLAEFGQIPKEDAAAAVGLGVQSVPDKPCVWAAGQPGPLTIPQAVRLRAPRRVVLMFGTNNTDLQPRAFIGAYERALDALAAAWPAAELVIAAAPPVGRSAGDAVRLQQQLDAFNTELALLAGRRALAFLDTGAVLKGPDGYLQAAYAEEDGLHLTALGAQALAGYFDRNGYSRTATRRPAEEYRLQGAAAGQPAEGAAARKKEEA